MSNPTLPKPQYSIWNAISAALAVGSKALEEVRALSREPGPKGDPGERGKDGKDAVKLADIKIDSPDGGRTFVFSFKDGDGQQVISKLTTCMVIDREIWKEEQSYVCGDFVTSSGSGWIARAASKGQKPGNGSDVWRLAFKRGANGKDGERGPPGPPGLPGRNGRDLTQMGPDGAKW